LAIDNDKNSSNLFPLGVFGFLFLLGVALCVGYVYVANIYCPVETSERLKSPLSHLLADRDYKDEQPGHEAEEKLASHSWFAKFSCEAKAADIALVFFTWCLVIATLWLGWATLKLWQAGESQMSLIERNAAEQSKDTRASTAVAERSAKAAEEAAGAASLNARAALNTERPYLFISAIDQHSIFLS
jgi:hypothetical protein